MGKRNRSIELVRHVIRPGEGTLVDVSITKFSEPGGISGAHLAINTSNAPVPDRRYVADVFSIAADERGAKLLFAQKRISKIGGFRSLLVIHMSARAVRQFLGAIENVRDPTFAQIAEKLSLEEEAPVTIDTEPDQTVALSANFGLCAVSGEEATIDLYQASPFAVMAVIQARKLALDAVVRIDLRSTVFLGMVAELKKVNNRFSVISE